MTKTPDVAAIFKDAMAAFPVDASSTKNAFKFGAEFNEKISTVALTATEKSTEVCEQWAQDTLKALSGVTKAKSTPADYMQSMTGFVTSYSKSASEQVTAFAEIAKQAQADTFELMTLAGKTFSAEATAARKDATAEVKKATAPAK